MHNLLIYAGNNLHTFLLKSLEFIIYLIVIVMGSCWMGSAIQGVLEELYKKEAASCLITNK